MNVDRIANTIRDELEVSEFDFLKIGILLNIIKETNKNLLSGIISVTGLERRTAYYFMKIARVFGPLGLDEHTLQQVGWTKLATIALFVDDENVFELIDLARWLTAEELKRGLKGKPIGKKHRVVVLYLRPKNYALYRHALLKHGAHEVGKGLGGQEGALMRLIKDSM